MFPSATFRRPMRMPFRRCRLVTIESPLLHNGGDQAARNNRPGRSAMPLKIDSTALSYIRTKVFPALLAAAFFALAGSYGTSLAQRRRTLQTQRGDVAQSAQSEERGPR